ncbi:hypothetical protein P8452_66892 [Trifolium repens]|nr:hypothetical protein P8452_66892 [Trifolium repens]
MVSALSLLIILLFNSTITTIAGRGSLPPLPPDPFITQPPEISFPLTPIYNKNDFNPPHHTSSPKNNDSNNHGSSPPWTIIAVGLGLGALALVSLLIGMCCCCLFSPTADNSDQVVVGVSAQPMPLHQWAALVEMSLSLMRT